jgi:hypothetical protein
MHVVGVGAVAHGRHAARLGDFKQPFQEFALAEVASVGRVAAEVLDVQFAGLDDLVPEVQPLGQRLRLFQFARQVRFAGGRDGEHLLAPEHPARLGRQER